MRGLCALLSCRQFLRMPWVLDVAATAAWRVLQRDPEADEYEPEPHNYLK